MEQPTPKLTRKQKLLNAWRKFSIAVLVVASILMIASDRLFRFYRIDTNAPSIMEVRELPFYREELLKRTKIRLLIAANVVFWYFVVKLFIVFELWTYLFPF